MRNQLYYHQAPNLSFVWRGITAASLLWLLAIFSLEVNANHTASEFDHQGIVASVDMPLHTNGEHSLSLKRFVNQHKDQTTSVKLPEPFWVLLAGDFYGGQLLFVPTRHNLAIPSFSVCAQQWQTPNVPRAPPLV